MAPFCFKCNEALQRLRRADAAVRAGDELQILERWEAARQLNAAYTEHLREAIQAGATFPNQPIELSPEDACLLNFGTNVPLLEFEAAAELAAERGVDPPPPGGRPHLPADRRRAVNRALGRLLGSCNEEHETSRVYNQEPWLQELYRDCLDGDYGDRLRRQIQKVSGYQKLLCSNVRTLGLPPAVQERVIRSFQDFRQIISRSHMLERDKTSFTEKRSYANDAIRIEEAIRKAEEHLGQLTRSQHSQVRELFAYYKEASYRIMNLSRELRTTWTGTVLDKRLGELVGIFDAVQATVCRCAEEEDLPQCPVLLGAEAGAVLRREAVEEAFRSLMMQDIIGRGDLAAARLEARRYGPLCVLVVPGRGRARYSTELVNYHSERMLQRQETHKRDYDLERRSAYPLNYLVLPNLTAEEDLLASLCEGWLEYKAHSQPGPYREVLEQMRAQFPSLFEVAEGQKRRENHFRRVMARYLAAVVRWTRSGEASELPLFAEVLAWARKRLRRPAVLADPRYRSLLQNFAEATPQKREEILSRHLGPRYDLDRRLLVVHSLRHDWPAFRRATRLLSAEQRQSAALERALEVMDEPGFQNRQKTQKLLQAFFQADGDLKTALLTEQSNLRADLGSLRRQLRRRGQEADDQALLEAVTRRRAETLEQERAAANAEIDRNLVGLLYAIDGNREGAIAELLGHLKLHEKRTAEPPAPPRRPREVDPAYIAEHFGRRQERQERPASDTQLELTRVAGGSVESRARRDPFVYFNLGLLYRHQGEWASALACLRRFQNEAREGRWHLFGEWADALAAAIRAERDAAEADEGAGEETGDVL